MNKLTNTARLPKGQLKPFTGDLRQAIRSGIAAAGSDGHGTGGLQGFLERLGRENPELAQRAGRYAQYFANSEGK
jgi:hypothetical protein